MSRPFPSPPLSRSALSAVSGHAADMGKRLRSLRLRVAKGRPRRSSGVIVRDGKVALRNGRPVTSLRLLEETLSPDLSEKETEDAYWHGPFFR
jgi:hypothetical protein